MGIDINRYLNYPDVLMKRIQTLSISKIWPHYENKMKRAGIINIISKKLYFKY